MTNKPNPTVAVLGTGIMGAGIARNLARNGFAVRAWNRTSARAQALDIDDVKPFGSAEEAVGEAGIIITVLKDGPAVHTAMMHSLPRVRPDAIWLQLSTVGAEATDRLASLAADRGILFFDSPVLGTRQPAEQGKLVILASGPRQQREIAQSVFDAIGQRTIWVADSAGAGSRLKLALNAYVFAVTHGTAEALAIARTLGVDPRLVVDAVTGGPLDSGFFQGKAAAMIKGDFETSFAVDNAIKDSELIVDALNRTGVQADLVTAGLERFRRAAASGHGQDDMAATYLA